MTTKLKKEPVDYRPLLHYRVRSDDYTLEKSYYTVVSVYSPDGIGVLVPLWNVAQLHDTLGEAHRANWMNCCGRGM